MKSICPSCTRLLLALLLTVMAGNSFGRTALYGARCDSLVLPPDSLRKAPALKEVRQYKKLAAKADTAARDTLRLTGKTASAERRITPYDKAVLKEAIDLYRALSADQKK